VRVRARCRDSANAVLKFTSSDGNRRNRSWGRGHPGQRDEAWFKREIVLKLDAFSLKEIGKATGLSLGACSRIRAGSQLLHPRHWEALRKLADS
jgi:hypothetical protein